MSASLSQIALVLAGAALVLAILAVATAVASDWLDPE